jgi:hypothetical protein
VRIDVRYSALVADHALQRSYGPDLSAPRLRTARLNINRAYGQIEMIDLFDRIFEFKDASAKNAQLCVAMK